jgi:hypothetical protein
LENNTNALYNWPRFYKALSQKGPTLLLGVDEDLRGIIQMSAEDTDMFWSEGLEENLRIGAADADMRSGVLSALELWRENVLDALESSFGIELDWETVVIDDESRLIDELVDAALPGESAPPH